MAQKRLRLMLLLLAIWDLGIGVYAVVFAGHLQHVVNPVPCAELLFIRGVGMYWLFAAYFQFLGFINPEKYLVAIQLSIIFRLSAAIIDLCEVSFLLGRPFYYLHYLLILFVIMNCIIAYITARYLRRMNLNWIW